MESSENMKWLEEQYPELSDLKDSDVYEHRKKQQFQINVERLENESLEPKRHKSFAEENSIKSLSAILNSINFPGGTIRSNFYNLLSELGLRYSSSAPSQKSIEMGYAQPRKDIKFWYCWNLDMLKLSVPSHYKIGEQKYFSKSALAGFFGWSKLYDVLKEHVQYSDDDPFTPTNQALACGLSKVQYMHEWHPDCVEEISKYFFGVRDLMKKERIQFEEAKIKGEWLGVKGSFPGNEPPMSLLFQLDPETFELFNSLNPMKKKHILN